MKETPNVLVVDDEVEMRIALSATLKRCNFKVDLSHSAADAINKIKANRYSLVLSDMTMPKRSGLDLLKDIKQIQPDLPFIIMTAYGTVETAVDAMKHGAFDYILKPFDFDTVVFLIERALVKSENFNQYTDLAKPRVSTKTNEELSKNTRQDYRDIITEDKKMLELLDLAKSVANSKASILIEAESGTGKELFANFIHNNSYRKNKPLVAINCAALPESLLESELFGHKKGSFTGAINDHKGKFEQANKGSILLDEITEMALPLQAKLLRVLQEQTVDRIGGSGVIPVDVRIIATTNRNILEYVDAGKFREDLYFRLNVIPLILPPLRERVGDIELLAKYFIEKHSKINFLNPLSFSSESLKIIKNYHWRGNVRELENVMERSVLLSCNQPEIKPSHLMMTKIKNIAIPKLNRVSITSLDSHADQDQEILENYEANVTNPKELANNKAQKEATKNKNLKPKNI